MEWLSGCKQHLVVNRRAYLGLFTILLTLAMYAQTVQYSFADAFRAHIRFTNLWALSLSLLSVGSLFAVYGFMKRWIISAPMDEATPSFALPRRQHVIGLMLAGFMVALCLPATFRSVSHPREVQIFWVDEGDTLTLVQRIVTGENPIPSYRVTQGWVTFLPVALALKGLHQFVEVEFTLTNVAMRCYQLLVIFGIVYFTYRLIWQISRSWWLAAAVVVIAYSRREIWHIALAIDRPDTFQLLFVLVSLLHAHRFWVAGQRWNWFLAVFFAAFAFASKYSGHLLAPVLLMTWIAHWRRAEVQLAYTSRWKYWTSGACIFGLSLGLIFPFTFFILSPYHLVFLDQVVFFFQTHLAIYKTGNVYSLPDFQPPSHIELWWGEFTSVYTFDYWLTVLGIAGACAAVVKNVIYRSKNPRVLGEWLLVAWGACYFTFLVYQYGLVGYRYIMPAQYVLPFFMLLPIYWLQQSTVLWRVPYRTVVGFAVVAIVFVVCQQRLATTVQFLGLFRSERSVQQCFDVGRYLDRIIPADENPTILLTNVAYIPPRLKFMEIRNVDVTEERLEKSRFDFVVMTDNMYAIYADKPTAGCEKQFDPLYKVHYVDVVETYTKFKNHRHPDYRYLTSFKDFHVFERIDRARGKAQAVSSD